MALSARRRLPRFCIMYEMKGNIRRVKGTNSVPAKKKGDNGFKPAQNFTHQGASLDS